MSERQPPPIAAPSSHMHTPPIIDSPSVSSGALCVCMGVFVGARKRRAVVGRHGVQRRYQTVDAGGVKAHIPICEKVRDRLVGNDFWQVGLLHHFCLFQKYLGSCDSRFLGRTIIAGTKSLLVAT